MIAPKDLAMHLQTVMYRFGKGDLVRVRLENAAIRTRKPHLRTPGYIFGLVGVIERECVGMADNPEGLAFRQVLPCCAHVMAM